MTRTVRRAIAAFVVDLRRNPYLGELMDDRWPQNLEGARKVRFDVAGWHGKPRFRLVYRNEPTDGAVGVMVVLAIGRRDKDDRLREGIRACRAPHRQREALEAQAPSAGSA